MALSDSEQHKSVVSLNVICRVLFTAFFFLYLYFNQAEIAGLSQHLFSGGKTVYNPLIGAIVVTILLTIIQWQGNRIWRLKGRFFAASYLPSCLALLALVHICEDRIGIAAFHAWHWAWLFPLCLLLFSALAIVMRSYDLPAGVRGVKRSIFSILWTNLLLFCASVCLVGGNSHSSDVFRYTLAIEKEIKKHHYDDALSIGEKSLVSSRQLSALRAYALSRKNELGERLFEYPQYYKSDGLLLTWSDSALMTMSLDTIFCYLGAFPQLDMSSQKYLTRLTELHEFNKPPVQDYALCMWLLDKELDQFADKVRLFYLQTDSQPKKLPKHYREAISLYNQNSQNPIVVNGDTLKENSWSEFIALSERYPNERERANRLRREFGKTYYYYWFYQQ